jgi:hypothetical protein
MTLKFLCRFEKQQHFSGKQHLEISHSHTLRVGRIVRWGTKSWGIDLASIFGIFINGNIIFSSRCSGHQATNRLFLDKEEDILRQFFKR